MPDYKKLLVFHDLNAKRPQKVRLLITQFTTSHEDWEQKDGLYFQKNPDSVWSNIDKLLTLACKYNVNMVIFPELSVPSQCISAIRSWSKKTGATVIAGSHYYKTNDKYISRCPIIVAGEIFFTEKITPAPSEKSPFEGEGIVSGNIITLIKNSPVGNFGVLICADYLNSDIRRILIQNNIDILCVPACQNNSELYYSRMNIDCEENENGIYIVYSNMKYDKFGDGRSALFGKMDKFWLEQIRNKGLTDMNPFHKIFEMNSIKNSIVIDVDLDHKRPYINRTVNSDPNVFFLKTEIATDYLTKEFLYSIPHTDEKSKKIGDVLKPIDTKDTQKDKFLLLPKESPSVIMMTSNKERSSSSEIKERYQSLRAEILNLAKRQQSIIKNFDSEEIQLEVTSLGEILSRIINKLQTDTLKVFVVGRFNSGKSTLINALCGQSILPSAPTPTTGVLCVIRYADEKKKKAVLFPKPGMNKNGNDSPFKVPISNIQEELRKYVKINNSGSSDETSRYHKLELYYPISLCKNDIEIIDYVGLDDPEYLDKVLLEYMPSVDVIIYCMDCLSAYSRPDTKILTLLNSLKFNSIFFVITKFDLVKDSFETGEIAEYKFKNDIYKDLTPWTELGKKGIMFVDSKSALLGKMKHNIDMIESSGILEVEQSLESFLIQEKGRTKLLSTLLSLKETNRPIRRIILSRISMLQTSIDELKKRYKDAELPLKSLEAKRQSMIRQFDSETIIISRKAYYMAKVYCTELHDKINYWASKYEIESSIWVIPTRSNIEPIVAEVINYLKEKIDEDTIEWTNKSFFPMIESSVENLKESLEDQARSFIQSVELLRVQVSVGEQLDNKEIAKQEEASPIGRLVGLGYMALTGDIINGGLGMALGMKAMLTTVTCEIVGDLLLVLSGPTNRVVIIGLIIAYIISGGSRSKEMIKSGVKTKVGNKIAEDIESHSIEICENIENKVKESLYDLRRTLDSGLASQITSIREDVEKVLEEKKSGKLNIDDEIKRLKGLESANNNIEETLDKLLHEAGLMGKT
jgi:Predicted amidohydrolase